jgi:hypothetical protein
MVAADTTTSHANESQTITTASSTSLLRHLENSSAYDDNNVFVARNSLNQSTTSSFYSTKNELNSFFQVKFQFKHLKVFIMGEK